MGHEFESRVEWIEFRCHDCGRVERRDISVLARLPIPLQTCPHCGYEYAARDVMHVRNPKYL